MDSLKKKIVVQSIALPVVLGLLLFLPAGSLAFWEAWVYCFLFLVSVLAIDVYFLKRDPELLARRMKFAEAGETEERQKTVQTLAGVTYFLSFLVPGLDYRFHWSAAPFALILVADVCVLAGFLIVFLVFRENSYTSSIVEVEKNQTVIRTGPYGIVRHPMYAGALLLFVSTPLALGSFWAFFFVVPLSLLLILRLLDEERFLRERLSGYTEYCQRTVYRLIPYVW